MDAQYCRAIGLIDKDGHRSLVPYRWSPYKVPREVQVHGRTYRHVEDHEGCPYYREVAEGYHTQPRQIAYIITDAAGRTLTDGVLAEGVPATLPYHGTLAVLSTIAGPQGTVQYTVEALWPIHP